MRKLSWSLSLAVLAGLLLGFGGGVQAQEGCNLQVGTAAGGTGQIFNLPVTIKDAPNDVDAMGFDLLYDPGVLQYTGTFSRGPLVEDWTFFDVGTPESGRLTVGGFTVDTPIQAGISGVVVILEFLVVCDNCNAGDVSELTAANLVDDIQTWDACPGTFRFVFCVAGQGLEVGDTRASEGMLLSIPARIAEPQGALNDVDAMGFGVLYDANILQYTGTFARGPLVQNWAFFDVNMIQPGLLRVGGFTIDDAILTGQTGTVVDLHFQVVCPACEIGDTSQLFIMELVDDVAAWPACPGTFTFGCAHCGDVNEDGEITPDDAMQGFEYFLERIVLTGCALEQCDINNDSACTPSDHLEIFKEFLGQPNNIDPACWPDA